MITQGTLVGALRLNNDWEHICSCIFEDLVL